MKKIIVTLLILCSSVMASAQQTANQLITEGVALFDDGKYSEALTIYEKALKIEPDNDDVVYEMGLTYAQLKDYDKAIDCANKVIKKNNKLLAKAYLLKGSALDYSGKPKDAIKVFKEGTKKVPANNSLYYSIAITSYNQKEFKEAEEALQSSLQINPLHANSHFLMGVLKMGEKSKSMLAFYNYLIIEPTGKRANVAFTTVSGKQKEGVEVKDDKSINITLNGLNEKDDFSTADMSIALAEAAKHTEENKNKSDFEMFSENTKSFFMILGELQANNKKKDFWWKYYVGFFYDLARNDEMYETFSYYIYQDVRSTAVENWLQKNPDRVSKLREWVTNYKR